MSRPHPPIALLAELTYRCPLACPYCSNPLEMAGRDAELDTNIWADVFQQAADLGVLQLHLSGGEPAARRDLVDLMAAAHKADLYTNLITSGIGLTEKRLDELAANGLDHVQLSLQGATAEVSDWVGGYKGGYTRKIATAEIIRDMGLPLTLNAVMHRHNLDDLPQTIDIALRLGARRIEIACVQFQGWALKNRDMLQPTRNQVVQAKKLVDEARASHKGQLVIDFVPPDYYADFPKACMGGWGSTGLNIAPDGTVLPCHAAQTIPSLTFQNVTETPLAEIWYDGPAFNAFRGTEWMPKTCQSCNRRDIDFGGCRCQAMAIVGQADAIDPICKYSPDRPAVDAILEAPQTQTEFIYRKAPAAT